jgi:2,3-bisphosphoglycerate-dependent phosphoglycerate mutase
VKDQKVCELVVVRHGETIWNAEGRQQGHLDSALSPAGLRQAEAIAAALAEEKFHALYSSDLGRAFSTAEAVSARSKERIVTDERLRERNLGIFQTLTMAEVEERYPAEYKLFRTGDPDYEIPSGESARQRFARSVACAEDIAKRHLGQRVVIVTHGGVLDGYFRRALSIPLSEPRRFKLFNASINSFFVQGGDWMLGTWGDVRHLKGIGTEDDR